MRNEYYVALELSCTVISISMVKELEIPNEKILYDAELRAKILD